MAFANPSITDIIATTIENRSSTVADNVTKNNAVLMKLSERGNVKPFTGGRVLWEILAFAENVNVGWYSGYDTLPVAAQDVISGAEFSIKQAACPVAVSGLEMIQNSGKEALIDLLESRIQVAEDTMGNLISQGLYSDGTGASGKQITGLDAAIPTDPTTGTYGGISRVNYTFWRSQLQDPASTPVPSTIQASMNALWASQVRGMDRPDLILSDSVLWAMYMASLQTNQRFTDPKLATLGFSTVKFMDADVVLDGGIGGFCGASTMFFLNTKYIKYRPHSEINMVPLRPTRHAYNQDAQVTILAWAGNLTTSGSRFQGRFIGT